MENSNAKRSARTTTEQLEYFISFCEKNPNVLTQKFDPRYPNVIQELWENLADSLNSLAGPTKTAKQWKETLSHWRNQVKSRARKCNVSRRLTGGGPPEKDELDEFEQRAMQTFGKLTVDGNENISVLGFGTNSTNAMHGIVTGEKNTKTKMAILEPKNANTVLEKHTLNKTISYQEMVTGQTNTKSKGPKKANTVLEKYTFNGPKSTPITNQELPILEQTNTNIFAKITTPVQKDTNMKKKNTIFEKMAILEKNVANVPCAREIIVEPNCSSFIHENETDIMTTYDFNSSIEILDDTNDSILEEQQAETNSPDFPETIDRSNDTEVTFLQEQETQTDMPDTSKKSKQELENNEIFSYIKRSAIANENVAKELRVLNNKLNANENIVKELQILNNGLQNFYDNIVQYLLNK